MNPRYRLLCRGSRYCYYCVDTRTEKRTSLGAGDEDAARRIVHAKNDAEPQPRINLQIAKAYVLAADSEMGNRTWQAALMTLTESKLEANRDRWLRAASGG